METKIKARKYTGSIVITIPSGIARMMRIKPGTEIVFRPHTTNSIIMEIVT
jgi:antitoxin component of MazEF toxin-antitoxin module